MNKKLLPLKYTLFFLLSLSFLQCNKSMDSALKVDFSSAELEAHFMNPPPESRPWVFWFWMNGNITKEGITADLFAWRDDREGDSRGKGCKDRL